MKNKTFKKLTAGLLTVLLILGLAGCGAQTGTETQTSETASGNQTQKETEEKEVEQTAGEKASGITFPLEEEVTFDVIVKYDGDLDAAMEKCGQWQKIQEETNVKVNLIAIGSENFVGTVNAMYAAGQEGDAILSGNIGENDLMAMVYSDFLLPLDSYLADAELMPNFNERLLADSPQTLNVMRAPDGQVYSLSSLKSNSGYYIESPMYINGAWLEALDMTVDDIQTIGDLEEVLKAFRDNDMDGDGNVSNEIPYLVLNSHAFSHLEAILGLWGISTKDNASDNYVCIKDGQVTFAPVTEAYKDAIKTLNRWWEENLIWSECFTGTTESYTTIINSETPMVGLITTRTLTEAMADDYVLLQSVSVEGYEASWFIHPGHLGNKGYMSLSKSCENPELFLAWCDLWYSFENTVASGNGLEEEGRWFTNEEGKVEFYELTAEETAALEEDNTTIVATLGHWISCLTEDDLENKMVQSEVDLRYVENYDVYEPYLTTEFWPRPYCTAEVNAELAALRTDINSTVSLRKAEWITGVADVDADWDAYVESLNGMGLERFVAILQEAYDVYYAK